jgi:malate dehydrogenase (oxaloacetate-decarboxylating)
MLNLPNERSILEPGSGRKLEVLMARVSKYYDVLRDEHGERFLEVAVTGFPLLRLPLMNKSTAFTRSERELLELDGLLPPHISTIEEQKERSYQRYRLQNNALEKHIYLRSLQDRNEVLFFALVEDHLEEMLPILYTPTVGDAVKLFSHIYRFPRGLSISTDNLEHSDQALSNVPLEDVRMIVATDSSAILGIGDQGFGGMAISIGKLSIYTVAGGVGPDKTLPVGLDVGTDRQDLINDPLYLGVKHKRLTGEAYDKFIDTFVESVTARYPKAIIQWEDFSKDTAFRVLERYRKLVPSFNDDIQGTGAVTLAGVLNALKLKNERLEDQTIVIHGAGAGGIGVAWAMRQGLMRAGLSATQAHDRVLVLDSKGLLLEDRSMEEYKHGYRQTLKRVAGWTVTGAAPSLLETIQQSKATVLLGLSGQGGVFTEPVVKALLENTPRPIVFPLSNPTANTEVLPEDALRWTNSAAIVATGSPFEDVVLNGKTYPIGQGNNAFIFPGLGFGAVLARAREITDGMVLEASYTLAEETPQASLDAGRVYPRVAGLREVSIKVAARVMQKALEDGVAAEYRIRGLDLAALEAFARTRFWHPKYLPFRKHT